MKKIVAGIFVGLGLGFGAAWLALRPEAADAKPRADAAPAGAEKPKENPLRVPAAQRSAFGFVLAKPAAATLTPEVSAYGRVLDPAPFITLAADLEVAEAALVASAKAAARARDLFAAGGNASRQNLEAAEAAEARDRALVAAARARLVVGFGRTASAPAPFAAWRKGLEEGRAIARLDVPAGETVGDHPPTARVGPALGGELADAAILGDAPTADPQVQGRSFLVLLGERSPPVGAALRATLPGAGAASAALVVPRRAIVYHQGSAWLFVLGEEDTFERKVVTVGRSLGDTVVVAGIEETDQVLTTGAGQLLSAELQAGGAPEEK